MCPYLAVVGPLPPPLHGVTVSTSLVLRNEALRQRFRVVHVDTSDHRTGENLGRWDADNVRVGLAGMLRLGRVLGGARRGVVYLPISQNRLAFLRDSIFIVLGAARGWQVAIHLRGSDFPRFFRAVGPLFRLWMRITLRLVSSAGVMGHSLRFVFGDLIPPERVAVVPNGTPEPTMLARPKESSTVVFLSNLRERKGVEPAVAAARAVIARDPAVRFVFVGAWESASFERRVRRLAGTSDRIEFRPPVAGRDKDALLASAAALLFCPVEPEGHPRVVLEAIATGLPVVATDQGAVAETVIDGESGYVLETADPNLLADRLLKLMTDPRLRERMGAAARRRYEERFTQAHADRALEHWLAGLAPMGAERA